MRKANEAVADIYDDAAQFLEDQGWCTDCSENRFSQHCVLIALLSTAIRHAVATGGEIGRAHV